MDKSRFKIDKNVKMFLGILLLYLIIMLIIFLPTYLRNRREKVYILTNFVKIKLENGKWNNITDSSDYTLKEFNVYENQEYKGKYKVLYSSKFHLFDNSGNNVSYNGALLAIGGTLNTEVYSLSNDNELTDNDISNINDTLRELKLTPNNSYSFFQKVYIDVDNDGYEESIYCVSNYYNEDDNDERFSIIFMNKDNKNYIIDKAITNNSGIDDNPIFTIISILDIRNDKKMEIFYTKNYAYRPFDECGVLYQLGGKRKVIKNFCKD